MSFDTTGLGMPNPEGEFAETMRRYIALMRELKKRVTSIENALNGQTNLPDYLVREYCFLQLRMVCELVALGCLVAHGDRLPGSIVLRDEHSAGLIMAGLERLHPDFYPAPIEVIDGGAHIVIQDPKSVDSITKAELVALNGRCGRYLHRGTRNSLFGARRRRRTVHFDVIAGHVQRIYNLLGAHTMLLADRKTMFFCILQNEAGNTQSWIAKHTI